MTAALERRATGGGNRFVGQRIARTEDARLLTGRGTYVDDISMPGTLHAAFVRSGVARGTINHIDVEAARALPGVIAVFTASDINPSVLETWVDYEGPPADGAPRVPYRPLADGDVRFAGEPVALVVAESRYLAEDAADAVDVDIAALPPVVTMAQALEADGPLVHPEVGTNLAGEIPLVTDAALDEIFAVAPHVITETFRQHRYTCVPMETRGIIAKWDPLGSTMEVWTSTQGPHGVRSFLSRALGLPENRVRVVMRDVGGGFGQKMFLIRDEVAVVIASKLLSRPVKWIEDRRENLMAGQHAREDHVTVSFAVDEHGTILGARADFLENVGAYPAAGSISIGFSALVFPGPYRIPKYAASGRAVSTNTGGRCSYRGPWMVETVAREQMMDVVARQLGIDPLEIRRRNVVRAGDLPYTTAVGLVYDAVSVDESLEQAATIAGYAEFRERQAVMRSEGRLVGIGLGLYMEPSGIAAGSLASEAATIRIGVSGQVEVVTSSASHGQGTETTIAQVVADELGIAFADITVLQGDTAAAPLGPGTGGSRSGVLCSGAARSAAQAINAKIREIAAHLLEASADDVQVADGNVSVVGTPARSIPIGEIALVAYTRPDRMPPGMELGLESSKRYTPSSPFTWSNSCHLCEVEIDKVTGAVTILRYVVSEDCGVMINPNIVEGQIAGGVVQGIGGVLYEHMQYDEYGNPLATTFVDYLLPTSTEVPIIEYGHIETPATTNPGGHKGLGEGGAIGSPAAIVNAVADALAPLGVTVTDQPLGPADIVALLAARGH